MWRKYGVQWEDPDEVARRIISGGSRSWRRKAEEEFLSQLLLGSETDVQINNATATTAQGLGINVIPVTPEDLEAAERKEQAGSSSRKRSRMDKDNVASGTDAPVTKRQRSDKAQHPAALPVPEAPLEPEPPRVRTLPCAVCNKVDPQGDRHLSCKDCRMSVHKTCYGVTSDAPSVNDGNEISLSSNPSKWLCDTCANDRDPRASLTYKCALCPVEYTEQELMEPPRTSHRRKSDREREKERLEKEMVTEAIRLYRERQIHIGKPINPREPLKRTEANNWVHVYCALFTPEVTFGDAKKLEPAEGLGLVARDRRLEMCRLCRQKDECGATVSCRNSSCNAKFHIGCARKEGYLLGFDLVPAGKPAGRSVSRGSISNIDAPSGPVVKIGNETGVLVPAIWCSYHSLPNTFHEISEHVSAQSGNLLQLYVQTYKQADLALTGTARKAAHLQQSVAIASQAQRPQLRARRSSGPHNHGPEFDSIGVSRAQSRGPHDGLAPESSAQRMCTSCSATASPRWYPSQTFKVSEPHLPPSQTHPPVFPGPPVNGVMARMHEIYTRKHAVGLRVNDRKEGVLVHAHPPPPAPLPPPRDQLNFPPPSELVQVTVYKCHKCHHQEMAAAQNANTSPVVTSQGVPGMSAPALSPEVAQPPPLMSHGFSASRPGMPVNAPPPANPVITLPPLQPPHPAAHPHIPPPAGHAPFSIGPPPPMSRASSAFSPAALPTTTAPIDRDRDVLPYAHQPGGVASLSRRLSHQSQVGPPSQPIAPQPRHPSQAAPGLQAPPTHRSPYPSIAQPVTLPPPIPSVQAQHVSRQAPPPPHGHLHSRFSPGAGGRDTSGASPVTQPSFVPHGPLATHNWPLNDMAAHPPPPGPRPPSVSHAPPPPVSIAPVSTSTAEAHHIPPPLFPAHAHPPPHIFRPRSNTSGFLPSLHMPSQLPSSTGPGPQSNVSGISTNPSPNVIAASPGTVLTSVDPSPAMRAQDGSHYSEGAAESVAGLDNSDTKKDPPTSPKQCARTAPTVRNLLI
ncbi:putative PHD type zinc finger protein with BAH domain-containing protein [Ascosphaera pollenicola]|nr:putative PHD type zinc finger protein with BAH domain-containing protein [Ascosphaera pollenicola]